MKYYVDVDELIKELRLSIEYLVNNYSIDDLAVQGAIKAYRTMLLGVEEGLKRKKKEEKINFTTEKQHFIQLLNELKDNDYDTYCHTGYSLLNEDQWDNLIEQVKNIEDLNS